MVAPIVSVTIGVFLLAGLWTPFAGVLLAAMELWAAFARGNNTSFHLLLAALGVSLMMLGPGAWSIDALLFGRKRIELEPLDIALKGLDTRMYALARAIQFPASARVSDALCFK